MQLVDDARETHTCKLFPTHAYKIFFPTLPYKPTHKSCLAVHIFYYRRLSIMCDYFFVSCKEIYNLWKLLDKFINLS